MSSKPSQTTTLDAEDQAILDKYVKLLRPIPGPISVWATTDEGLLHFYTLVSPDQERAVYGAQMNLLRAIDPVLVDFDVHIRDEHLRSYLFKDQPPLFYRD